MGGADGNGNVETREALEPLAEMANRLGIAVVAVSANAMSAVAPITDSSRTSLEVRFVPSTEVARVTRSPRRRLQEERAEFRGRVLLKFSN